jgi:hypothetical protein
MRKNLQITNRRRKRIEKRGTWKRERVTWKERWHDMENNVKVWIDHCYKKISKTMQYKHFSLLWVNGNICYLRWHTLKIWCEGCLILIWNLYRVAFTLGPKNSLYCLRSLYQIIIGSLLSMLILDTRYRCNSYPIDWM